MPKYRKDNKHHRGDAWQELHGRRYNGACVKCAKSGPKKEMPALYLRKEHIDSMRILCRICHDCLPGFLADLGVEMPE